MIFLQKFMIALISTYDFININLAVSKIELWIRAWPWVEYVYARSMLFGLVKHEWMDVG